MRLGQGATMTIDRFTTKAAGDRRFAAFVVVSGIAIGLVYHAYLWTIGENGFSEMSDRLPYWDFTNLWAGSRMALDGNVATLFDIEAYRAALRAMFSPLLPNQEWSYPPSILLLGAPLATLPIMVAYFVWTFGTIALLHCAIRPLGLPRFVHLTALASPAIFINAMFGQNGALTAALLIGGLLAAPKRPILAGVLFGLLTVKPHLGILIPFCLIASRNWRAFASAATTSVLLAAATGVAFGFEVWPLFADETRTVMTAIMEAPYPQPYHANALTVFILARSLGAGVDAAYVAQAAATLIAIAAAFWLWLPSTAIDHRRRALATATLAIAATPYGYTYDTIPMCVAIAYMFAVTDRPRTILVSLAWLFPYIAHLLNFEGIGIGVLVPIAVAVWMGVSGRMAGQDLSARSPGEEPADRSDRMRTVTTLSR